LEDYVRWLLKKKMKAATIHNYLTITTKYCEWLRSTGIEVPAMAKPMLPRMKKHRMEILPEKLIPIYNRACIEYTDDPLTTALLLLPMSGLRVSEMCLLENKQVVLGPPSPIAPIGTAQFQFEGKGGKYRRVPILAEGIPILANYIVNVRPKLGRNRWLFPASRSPNGHITRHQVSDRLRRIKKRIGVDKLHPHLLRHTYGTILNEAKLSEFDIAEILGHGDVRVTAKYVHPVESRLLTDVNQLSYRKKK
jgi:integrase